MKPIILYNKKWRYIEHMNKLLKREKTPGPTPIYIP
jgi:hypothetical protein